MDKDNISTKAGINSMIMFILGTTIILSGVAKANQDSWIALILAIAMAIPMFLVYAKISSSFPGKNLYRILDIVFGKVLGNIFSILYIFYFLHLASLSTRNMTEFVQVVSFPDTPQYFYAIFLGVLVVFMIKSGLRTLGSTTNLLLPLTFILIIPITLMAIPQFKLANIMPILYGGWKPVFHSALSLFSFPMGECVVFLALFDHLDDETKSSKIYLTGLFIGGFVLLITTLKNIFLLGFPNLVQIIFPSYYANSLVSIGDFIQRMEVATAIILLLCGFAKTCVLSMAVCIGISKLFKFPKYEDIAVPIVLVIIILSMILYTSTMEMIEFLEVYTYYAMPFQILLPVLTLVVGKIRGSWKK